MIDNPLAIVATMAFCCQIRTNPIPPLDCPAPRDHGLRLKSPPGSPHPPAKPVSKNGFEHQKRQFQPRTSNHTTPVPKRRVWSPELHWAAGLWGKIDDFHPPPHQNRF